MAVYKLFSEKDTTILSQYPAQNTGRDEILDISNYNGININSSAAGDLPAVARSLVQFKQSTIDDIVDNTIGSSNYKANLKLFLANAENAPLDYEIYAYPVSGAWDMGTGRTSDSPKTEDGCCWGFRGASGSNAWTASAFTNFVTASYGTAVGGGNWYTGSTTVNPEASQSFTYTSDKDISLDVTNAVKLWTAASFSNDGFIVKLGDEHEFVDEYVETQYFSMDTHTIYPPKLNLQFYH